MPTQVSSDVVERLLAEAGEAHPRECCGLLFGTGDTITSARPTANVHREPSRHFEIDPRALLDAHRAAREGGRRLVFRVTGANAPAFFREAGEIAALDQRLAEALQRYFLLRGHSGIPILAADSLVLAVFKPALPLLAVDETQNNGIDTDRWGEFRCQRLEEILDTTSGRRCTDHMWLRLIGEKRIHANDRTTVTASKQFLKGLAGKLAKSVIQQVSQQI